MIKNLKKLFVCIFMLIFSSICVVNMSTFASAWPFDEGTYNIGVWDPKEGWREKYFQNQHRKPVSPFGSESSSSSGEEDFAAPSSESFIKLLFPSNSKKLKKAFANLYNSLIGGHFNSRSTFRTDQFDKIWEMAPAEQRVSILIPIIKANPSLQHYLPSQK